MIEQWRVLIRSTGVSMTQQKDDGVGTADGSAACFRCGRSGFATLELAASFRGTRLEVAPEAARTVLCSVCLSELAPWFNSGERSDHAGLEAALGGALG